VPSSVSDDQIPGLRRLRYFLVNIVPWSSNGIVKKRRALES